MSKLIEPKILKGTRDFLPEEMAKRNFVLNKIVRVFQLFGYDQIDTPAIEYAQTLLGKYGDEGSKQMFRFKDNGGRDVALRFDQTVPFARLVAANYSNLPMPFKRYQISKVWRADKPAKGRYREFTQCDIDIIGTNALLADVEIALIIYRVFKELGFEDFVIKINDRQLLNRILDGCNIDKEKQVEVIRIIDKMDKIGRDGVKEELLKILDEKKFDNLFSIITLSGSNQEKLELLSQYQSNRIVEFIKNCQQAGIEEKNIEFDVSLARGLDYYTGIIYEVYLGGVEIGAVCAGGRYDNLCGLFTDKNFSGVGVAFGFDRIILAMESLQKLNQVKLSSNILIVNFSKDTLNNSLQILRVLQEAGINCEIYFEEKKLDKQFKYADKKQVEFVVISGPEEISQGTVKIKNMKNGKQKKIPQSQIVDYFKGYTKLYE